jgi:hypothetical protein
MSTESNEEIVALLDGLRSARADLEVQKSELIRIGEGRADPTLKEDIHRFLQAFDLYQSLALRALDAVYKRIDEPLLPDARSAEP